MQYLSLILAAAASCAHALSAPSCQSVAPSQTELSAVHTAMVSVPGQPFGVTFASQQNNTAFVVLSKGSNNSSSVGVLDTSSFPPTLSHTVAIPSKDIGAEGALGVALTHSGQYLLVAASKGAVIVDAAKAASGSSGAIVGDLDGNTTSQNVGVSAIEVTISPDDQFAFVSQEYGPAGSGGSQHTPGNVDVFKLQGSSGTPVGFLSLGLEVVGTAISPDGKTMYAASEQSASGSQSGIVSVIDLATLESTPDKALTANVSAGCAPVRTLVSSDGSTLWVTARESNMLLAFNISQLTSDPSNALVASVQVGTAPVGLTFVNNGSMIITADSNRFNASGATSGLSVVDVQAALAGQPSMLGRIPTGLFPREFATSADGKTLLVSDFDSSQVQAVDLTTLPSASNSSTTSGAPLMHGSSALVYSIALALACVLLW